MCTGASVPFDHPHIYIDMGADAEKVCSYCSTLFKYNPSLKKIRPTLRAASSSSRPPEAITPKSSTGFASGFVSRPTGLETQLIPDLQTGR